MLALSLAGCESGTKGGGSDAPGVKLPAPSVAAGPHGAAAASKMSIASSSQQDIAAQLHAHGVDDNPEHWAKVIVENEPYPSNDANLGKLKQVLTQNRANPTTVDQIVQALAP